MGAESEFDWASLQMYAAAALAVAVLAIPAAVMWFRRQSKDPRDNGPGSPEKRLSCAEVQRRYRAALDLISAAPGRYAVERRTGLWRHGKSGRVYQVVVVGLEEGSMRPVIAYWSTTSELVWVRPLDEFLEKFTPVAKGEQSDDESREAGDPPDGGR